MNISNETDSNVDQRKNRHVLKSKIFPLMYSACMVELSTLKTVFNQTRFELLPKMEVGVKPEIGMCRWFSMIQQ